MIFQSFFAFPVEAGSLFFRHILAIVLKAATKGNTKLPPGKI